MSDFCVALCCNILNQCPYALKKNIVMYISQCLPVDWKVQSYEMNSFLSLPIFVCCFLLLISLVQCS